MRRRRAPRCTRCRPREKWGLAQELQQKGYEDRQQQTDDAGRATTNAVVGAIVLILAVNYLITALFVE